MWSSSLESIGSVQNTYVGLPDGFRPKVNEKYRNVG